MPWGRLEDTLHENEKIATLTDREFRVWVLSMSRCNRKRKADPEGRISRAMAEELCRQVKATTRRQIATLIAGMLERRPPNDTAVWDPHPDGAYVLHDFPDFGPKEDKTAADRKRAERDRRRASRGSHARDSDDSHGTVTRDSHARARPGPVPGPVPVADALPSEHQPEEQAVEQIHTSAPAAPERAPTPPKSLEPRYSAEFEEWWSAYPRKREKVEAFAVYEKTLKAGATVEDLLAAARNYATAADEDGAEDRHIKLPATFLSVKDRPWLDFRNGVPRSGRTPKPARNGQGKPSALVRSTANLHNLFREGHE